MAVLGQAYAIRRYAKLENLPFYAAQAAALPYGVSALLHRYYLEENLNPSHVERQRIDDLLLKNLSDDQTTAYVKTGRIQQALHLIARDRFGAAGRPDSTEREQGGFYP